MSTSSILPRVHIGEVIRNAVVFNPENHQKHPVNADSLIETVARFFALLHERRINYVLVGGAKYKTSLIEPIQSRVDEMWKASAAGAPGLSASSDTQNRESRGFIAPDEVPPQLREAMKKINRQHWESWFDLPIPAINNMTPSEAAKTDEGRDLLESLLLLYQSNQDRASDTVWWY